MDVGRFVIVAEPEPVPIACQFAPPLLLAQSPSKAIPAIKRFSSGFANTLVMLPHSEAMFARLAVTLVQLAEGEEPSARAPSNGADPPSPDRPASPTPIGLPPSDRPAEMGITQPSPNVHRTGTLAPATADRVRRLTASTNAAITGRDLGERSTASTPCLEVYRRYSRSLRPRRRMLQAMQGSGEWAMVTPGERPIPFVRLRPPGGPWSSRSKFGPTSGSVVDGGNRQDYPRYPLRDGGQ